MDFCARCGQQVQPGQPSCPRCGPNHAATTDKITFVSLWNPIAARYGLPAYRQDQL